MELIILLIVVIGSITLGLFVIHSNPKNIANQLVLTLNIFISLWTVVNYLSISSSEATTTLFWVRLTLFFAVPQASILYLLTITLAKEKIVISTTKIISIVAITILVMGFTLSASVIEGINYSPIGFNLSTGPLILLFTGFVISFSVLAFISLVRRFLKSEGIEKSQLGYVLLGLELMLGMIIGTIVVPFVFFHNLSAVAFAPIYVLLFLIFVAYAIVKHRMLEVKQIVARTVSYSLLIILVALIYISLLFLFTTYVLGGNYSRIYLIISVSLALFISFSFPLLRRYIEKLTDRIFYKDRYDSQELLWSLSRIMASTLNLSQITKKILDKMLADMKITYGSVVLIRDASVIWVGSEGTTMGHPFKGSEIYHLIQESIKPSTGPERLIVYEELSSESKLKQVMRTHEITIVLPLTVRDELIGGILFGQKASGEIYSSEDIDVFKIVAPEIAVAIKNALSFDEIKRFNITLEEEVKAATQRLRNANHRLKELDNLKDEFVSIASHELRTPMTAIKSYLWMAINQPGQKVKEPLNKYLSVSYNSTERLIRLVNDMLTVSRIERNKIELKLSEVDVYDILKQVYDELRVTAEERKIKYTVAKKDATDYFVKGDKEKLREVFQNIVGNALKFTSANGYIKVEIEKVKGTIRTSISDSGTGIPKESIKDLFKKFSKIDYSYAKHSNQPGTGLGLYISKQIVSLHGGDIQVESEVNVGTTFTVILPSLKKGKEVKT